MNKSQAIQALVKGATLEEDMLDNCTELRHIWLGKLLYGGLLEQL